jgi:hypothetical protein
MRTVRIALAAATLWGVGLVAAALTLPAYTGSSSTSGAGGTVETDSTTATFVDVNGTWGLVLVTLPLAACVLVAALLLGPGGRVAQVAAAVLVGLLGALALVSLLSIGVFIAPVVAGLGVAVVTTLGAQRTRAAT